MDLYVVMGGEASRLDLAALPERETYGYDWIVVEALDEADALGQAEAWDASHGAHPVSAAMFAAAYRAGAVALPGDVAQR